MILRGDTMKEIIKCKTINTLNGGQIPIDLIKDNKVFSVEIDGVQWFTSDNLMHASILFEMLCKHVTEYMRYIST